jgi:hypothetical protein
MSREFFEDPVKHLPGLLTTHPSHIVIWGSLYTEAVAALLSDFRVIKTIFHAHWTESPLGYEANVNFLILARGDLEI